MVIIGAYARIDAYPTLTTEPADLVLPAACVPWERSTVSWVDLLY